MEGKTLETAAAAADMSERTARTWKTGPLPSETKTPRSWRTRPDPFAGVWVEHVVPMLVADEDRRLEAKTIIAVLEDKVEGKFRAAHVRTMQRRVRQWRALHGPPKTVYFQQEHPPGREGAFDFTHGTELGVTILGQVFRHLLFQFVLVASGWRWIELALGETFEAVLSGVQGALWELGGVPHVIRHDNLSAATRELARTGGRELNARFGEVIKHYETRSSRISPGESHENGAAEKANDLLKSALEQALIVRGSRDFTSPEAYLAFARDIVEQKFNRPAAGALADERPHLKPLPSAPIPSYTSYTVQVRKWSTITVGHRIYSVPSRLIGHDVEVRLHPNELEVRFAGQLVERMPRLRGDDVHHIDYRHVIWSLVRKPGAFERYRYREDLFPTLVFRRAYDALREHRGDRADVEYVRVLHLAASTMQGPVERALGELLDRGKAFEYADVKARIAPDKPAIPAVAIGEPDLVCYDALLSPALCTAGGAA